MEENGSYYPKEDMNYLGESLTVEEYQRMDTQQIGIQEGNGGDGMHLDI